MSETDLIEKFASQLQGLIGEICWSVQVSGIGSLANLHFGTQRNRSQPLLHQDFRLSMEERAYQGEYILYLEECPWRLDDSERVLATWMDESEDGGRISENLPRLNGARVEKVEVCRPGLDLTIWFANGMTLRVFPDQVDAEVGDNYSVVLMDETYVIAANSTLYID